MLTVLGTEVILANNAHMVPEVQDKQIYVIIFISYKNAMKEISRVQ